MKLSIIIPAYNEEKLISKCLDSIFENIKDMDCDVEVIVVNNASTDRTKEIVMNYKDVILIDEPNKGVVKARQAGYKKATGDLLVFIDADNIMPKGWIKRVMNHFNKNEKLVGISGPLYYYDLSPFLNIGVIFFYFLGYIVHQTSRFLGFGGTMCQGGNFVLKKSALDQAGGFNTNLIFYGEDTDIAMNLRKFGDIIFDFGLKMNSSGRRLKKEGVIKTAWNYSINYLSMIFIRKPVTPNYIDIRE